MRLLLAAALQLAWAVTVSAGPAELRAAARAGDLAAVERELAAGVRPGDPDPMTRKTALHQAAAWGNLPVLHALLAVDAPRDARDWDGETALYQAALRGRHEAVAALIEAGASIDIPDERGMTPLVAALAYRPDGGLPDDLDDPFVSNLERVRSVFAGRAEIDHEIVARLLAGRTQDIDRAFAEAVWSGYGEAARILLRRGAIGQARTLDGRAALAGSFHHDGLSMFEAIVAATSNLSIDGNAAMTAAAAAGRTDIVDALLARRYPPDTRDEGGRTPLMAATVEARMNLVTTLLESGADPTLRDAQDRSMTDLMTMRLATLLCLAEQREASAAWRPTDHIRAEAARLGQAYAAILALTGLPQLPPQARSPECDH